jgi:hypothetical protein
MKKFIISEKFSEQLRNNDFFWQNFIKNSQKDDEKTIKIVQEIICKTNLYLHSKMPLINWSL